MGESRSGRAAREEREKMLILKHKFDNRITTARFGKESFDVNDYGGALKRYSEYLTILAEIKKCPDLYALRPQHFDPKKEITELLLISQIFFEMARMYDAVPKFHEDSKKCLEQFVTFSANQPFQVVNSELVRKHLKKSVFKNPDVFRNAYQQIFVQSKKCYVVTFCFGETHPLTQEFRAFKDELLNYPLGQELVRHYYNFSSVSVPKWEKSSFGQFMGFWLVRPALIVFSKTVLRFILPR